MCYFYKFFCKGSDCTPGRTVIRDVGDRSCREIRRFDGRIFRDNSDGAFVADIHRRSPGFIPVEDYVDP